jgi:hypothetical protein
VKLFGITSAAILLLPLVISVPVCAQERQGEKQDRPEHQQSKQAQAKPEQQRSQPQHQAAQKEQQPQHAQQQERAQQPQHAQQQKPVQQHAQQQEAQRQQKPTAAQKQAHQTQHARQQQPANQTRQPQRAQQHQAAAQHQRTPEQQRVQQSAWQEHRSRSWNSDHRTWQQRGGYNGYRIPDDRFHGYFGQDHGFRINGLPFLVVGGYPRFQYEGYWFSMVDPWPEYWSNDWYDTDDVYVTYVDNGYYLFDRRYPNTGIAISISM